VLDAVRIKTLRSRDLMFHLVAIGMEIPHSSPISLFTESGLLSMETVLSRDDVARRLVAHLAKATAIDEPKMGGQALLADLGLDSLLLAIILRNVEVDFAIEFKDDEIAAILGAATIDEYVDILYLALSDRRHGESRR
jgi:acyl carrier protein